MTEIKDTKQATKIPIDVSVCCFRRSEVLEENTQLNPFCLLIRTLATLDSAMISIMLYDLIYKTTFLNLKNNLQAQRPWFVPQSLYLKKKPWWGLHVNLALGRWRQANLGGLLARPPHLLGKFQVSYRLSKYCVALEDCVLPSTCMPTHVHVFLYTREYKQTHDASALSSPKEIQNVGRKLANQCFWKMK